MAVGSDDAAVYLPQGSVSPLVSVAAAKLGVMQ